MLTSTATALLLCLSTAGTAAADDVPTDDDGAVSADETTDINDRQGWEDDTDQPLSELGPTACEHPSTWYSVTSKKAYHVPSGWNGTKYKDGPGGTIKVSVTKGGTISLEVSGSGEWSAGALLAKAKVTVSAKVAGSVTVTTGHEFSHEVTRNKYGHLQYGSWGYKVNWKRYRSSGRNCGSRVEIGHGKATLPTTETGWKYWETSS
ncbi:hypothetical protein [Streptomyces spongiae]|uniref:hypothetical protein n=1 Tax=Streptomyces spongiae TaxID=565072 RepID=UPI001D13EAFF|nr:hypothetical protein [Streptomyces spongiae]